MAITWGTYEGHQAVGIDVSMSPTSVTKDTASVTLTWKVYTKTDGWDYFSDNQTMTMSNALSASTDFVLGLETPGDAVLVGTYTQSVSTSYSATVAKTLVATVSGQVNGGTPSVSRSYTVPKRPPQLPAAATSITTTRVNDTQMTVSWVRPASASTDANIWTNVKVNRRSSTASAWVTVATLAGTATSWTDTTTGANNSYQYQVVPTNVSGSGTATTAAAYLDTTPSAPSNVVAAKTGSDIVLTWTSNSPASSNFEIYDNAVLLTTVGNVVTYTHVAPSAAVTHQYTIRAKTDNPVLYSTYGTSNTVQLLAPPNAPTALVPAGGSYDIDQNVVFSWTHNPVDSSAQRTYQLQFRALGSTGAWTTATEVTSSASTATLSPATIATYAGASGGLQWQVRTSGSYTTADTTDMSPWSATAIFELSHKPTVTLSVPTDGQFVTTPSLAVTWSYYQADGHTQSDWQADIYQGDTLIASGTGTTETTWPTGNVLQNGNAYTVRVRVRENGRLWSDYDTANITVAFPVPLASVVVPTWDWEQGFLNLAVQAQSNGVAPDAVSTDISRSIDGGATWTTLVTGLNATTDYQDWTAPVAGTLIYRVTAVTALPSATVTEFTVATDPVGRTVYLSCGPGYTTCVRLRFDSELTVTLGSDVVLNRYAGRRRPVSTSGIGLEESVSVSATVLSAVEAGAEFPIDGSVASVLRTVFSSIGPRLYRDTQGLTMQCSVSPMSLQLKRLGKVSFVATRCDDASADQLATIWESAGDPSAWGWVP